MQIHELKPLLKSKRKKRVGRGGKRGTYSGRGIKGQKARAGRKMKSQLKEMILKFPKRRGSGFKRNQKKEIIEIHWSKIINKFPEGGEITPKILKEAGIIEIPKSKKYLVKIIGRDKVRGKYIIKNCATTKILREAIIKEGGKIFLKNG